MAMPSGGARARSGPAPDPSALRRDRKDDAGWTSLPAGGFTGEVPEYPLADESGAEGEYWSELWRKPQAVMWSKLGMVRQVAAYVRAYCESVLPEASAGLKTAVLRMEGELGISVPGMHSLRWKIADDELAERRENIAGRASARDRLKALNA